ncbi:hypothetical protein C8J56DRAFT_899685 [Mycena floridula]|nr:hypothetical protein C8J56DRAFT_899685 [Mycena floridula]
MTEMILLLHPTSFRFLPSVGWLAPLATYLREEPQLVFCLNPAPPPCGRPRAAFAPSALNYLIIGFSWTLICERYVKNLDCSINTNVDAPGSRLHFTDVSWPLFPVKRIKAAGELFKEIEDKGDKRYIDDEIID